MIWCIKVAMESPSLNKFTYQMSPFVQVKAKKLWWALIRSGSGFLEVPRATCKRRLLIERHGKRRLDPDNLIGGAKCCITDNLKKFGLIVDDSEEWLVLEARNVPLLPSEHKGYTILYLEDVCAT